MVYLTILLFALTSQAHAAVNKYTIIDKIGQWVLEQNIESLSGKATCRIRGKAADIYSFKPRLMRNGEIRVFLNPKEKNGSYRMQINLNQFNKFTEISKRYISLEPKNWDLYETIKLEVIAESNKRNYTFRSRNIKNAITALKRCEKSPLYLDKQYIHDIDNILPTP